MAEVVASCPGGDHRAPRTGGSCPCGMVTAVPVPGRVERRTQDTVRDAILEWATPDPGLGWEGLRPFLAVPHLAVELADFLWERGLLASPTAVAAGAAAGRGFWDAPSAAEAAWRRIGRDR